MKEQLFIEIDKFENYAQTLFYNPQGYISTEWEREYKNWKRIYKSFKKFIFTTNPELWSDKEKERLLHIIARNNFNQYLASLFNEQALITLTKAAISNGNRDDKWQLAVQLHKLSDKQIAITLLDQLVNDEEEYVNRRSLMELAKLQSDKVEHYAEIFWNRNKYGEMDEYQKMAVLHSLKLINSAKLNDYIQMAKQDGRRHLVYYANKIEAE